MADTMAHIRTANSAYCSCGMSWIDHCEKLLIRNEKLTEMLKRVVNQSYEHERNHRQNQALCSCSSIRIDARKLLAEDAPKDKVLTCAWCGRPQPYGVECVTQSGKNVCYDCTYEAPAFTHDGKTVYLDRPI